MRIKAICFDLYGTLAYVKKPVGKNVASDFLIAHGYEVYPQALDAGWYFVSLVDYPKYGYKTWRTEIKRVMRRLDITIDKDTLKEFAELCESNEWTLFPDTEDAIDRAKKAGLRTAMVTTIAGFKYRRDLHPILQRIDLLVDGYKFHCEKSNPKIYLKTLEALGVNAHEAVMIGDDIELDIKTPRRLNMKTILLDRTGHFSSSSDCEDADAVVRNLNQAIETALTL